VHFDEVAYEGATYAGVHVYDNITFRRGGNLVMGDLLEVVDNMSIEEYGMLTHFDATASFTSMLDLTVGNLIIDETSRIDATGRGYLGGKGWYEQGRTLGNVYGSASMAGGSYGGLGGSHNGAAPNAVYGSEDAPGDLGSGGGGYQSYVGGDGGGRIFINAGSIVLDGDIRANGETGGGYVAGNGSGGTVRISTGALYGSGTITANGAGGSGVGGGGGRIAIFSSETMEFSEENIHAEGGHGSYGTAGQDGTITIE
jgi:hypothetical protein